MDLSVLTTKDGLNPLLLRAELATRYSYRPKPTCKRLQPRKLARPGIGKVKRHTARRMAWHALWIGHYSQNRRGSQLVQLQRPKVAGNSQ